ncbi:TetR family transcriptional regulator [Methylobacterium sp. Leaf94]|uniref:TetR/AcrR family transcriptional regulator n=1 Tax=Methylobacterium sp. Leaf94 TaxID=1736250 RepID=UPI000700A1D5|nr:TetR/AcrR family transcriptional regulator [Methylobacterium sp. Leaf94]KQU17595.1 TetR family transcriptional regulator [Methylobacterium sp. Leaf94]
MQKPDQRPEPPGAPQVRGRGRPRAFDRKAALAQAMRLFWCKGYEATSITELTEAMGIGSPSLYAAFGSKEALYAEALSHYVNTYEALVWGRFRTARTAREAVEAFLKDSAAALTGSVTDIPRGCMVTLSSVGNEGHAELGDLVRSARAGTLESLQACLERAMGAGELPASTNVRALSRFVQTVQNGMSILARDGASREELDAVADIAMAGWDARVAKSVVDDV